MFLCTGRSRSELWPDVTDIGFDGLVGGAGAYVEVGGVELLHRRLEAGQVRQVIDFFGRHGLDYFFEGAVGSSAPRASRRGCADCCAVPCRTPSPSPSWRAASSLYLGEIVVTEQPPTVQEQGGVRVRAGVTFAQIRDAFAADFDVIASSVPLSGATIGEIQLAGVHKASGIEQVTEHLGIARRDTLAIGDSDNDLEMLRHAGVGIAMGNARQHAREAADEVTSRPRKAACTRPSCATASSTPDST